MAFRLVAGGDLELSSLKYSIFDEKESKNMQSSWLLEDQKAKTSKLICL